MSLSLQSLALLKAVRSVPVKVCATFSVTNWSGQLGDVGGVGVSFGARSLSTSRALYGKRNFRKFHLGNKRGTRLFRKARNAGELPGFPIETEVQPLGFKYGARYHIVPEMVPDFIVPDLTDCQLKPYVSYRAGETYQNPFTAEDLFMHVYFNKLNKDFTEGHLDEHGNPLTPSPEESLTPDEAWMMARQTGSDIFSERIPRQWECLEIDLQQWKEDRLAGSGLEQFYDVMKEPYSPDVLLEEHKKYDQDDDAGPDKTSTSYSQPNATTNAATMFQEPYFGNHNRPIKPTKKKGSIS